MEKGDSSLRVISGKNRGTKLLAPEGMATRPTTDRIKETLFNMISFDLPGCTFLDLFSGSGGIAIEALSRGSKEAVLVENNKVALDCIYKNLEKTRLQDKAIVYNIDVESSLQKLVQQKKKFDIIFLDPPYALERIQSILEYIGKEELLEEKGYIILEQSTDKALDHADGLTLIKKKQYKTTTISFFERTVK